MLNDQLIAELPQLLNLRVPYFDPSFEAMIRMQAKFAEEGYEKLSGVQRSIIFQKISTSFRLNHFVLGILPITSGMTTLPVNLTHRSSDSTPDFSHVDVLLNAGRNCFAGNA